jgi:hypothetical protein
MQHSFGIKIATMLAIIGVLLMPLAAAQQGPGGQMGGPVPEIDITGIQFSNTDAIEGQDVTISVTVENLNSTASISDITLSLYVDYEVVQNFTAIELGAGESKSFNYVWASDSGTHNVTAILMVNGMPLPATQMSSEFVVALGDTLSLVLSILVLAVAIFVIAIIPSIITKYRP